MNNTRSSAPETNTILGTGSTEEIENFVVNVLGTSQIFVPFHLSLNQVVTELLREQQHEEGQMR